jgi:hypothetical protein
MKILKKFKRYFVDETFNWINQKTQKDYNPGLNNKYLS